MIYIEQPPFLPWLGFCEALIACTSVALYDDVQFTQGGWQNRNRIKTANGPAWVTVPVVRATGQLIRDTRIADDFRHAEHGQDATPGLRT
ncbi:WbqC family protein [Streptomyces sp. GMY02]|uniref:WbqC family protein n=1 Tax=Streptomyces sp. GMY02 TaxID=1333528 RepID=UPI0020B8C072|nr:WbqC family protein [Streptomyces sp. GMY02]